MELKDFLHYYMGATFTTNNSEGEVNPETLKFIYPMIEKNKDVKLVLRRLEDITQEEWDSIESETSLMIDAHGLDAVRDNFLIGTDEHRLGWAIVNDALIAMRKRGIDVDGLIPAGLAIDAKTLTP